MSSLMDAISGGAPGGPPPGPPGDMGGPPPGLAGMLGGMGGPGGPPPGPPEPEGPPAPESTSDVIKQMVEAALAYLDIETDEQEKAQMAAVLKSLQDFLAREQKEEQDAMGGKMSPRLLSKAYSG